MIIKGNETLKNATLTANSNNINYPVTNILDSRLSRLFKTDLDTTAEIVFDAGSAVEVNTVSIANHNLSAMASIKFQGNDTDAWTSPSVDEILTWDAEIITKVFTGGTHKYWRLQVIDPTNINAEVSLGRVSGGIALTTPGINTTLSHDRNSASVKSISSSGNSYQDRRYLYDVISTTFPAVNHAEKQDIFHILESVDIGEPFFVTFDEDCSDLGTLYVTLNQGGFSAALLSNTEYYTINIGFIQEV